jgi:ELWxxDGT repeat protein
MLTNVNGTLFFAATDGVHGRELWKSDGTEAGTALVRDIHPSGNGLGYFGVDVVEAIGDHLYFSADDGVSGFELWRTDGTEAGTVRLRDVRPGDASSNPSWLASVNGRLYFVANGNELWTSNGEPQGTVLVRSGLPGFDRGAPQQLAGVDGSLYFSTANQYGGTHLWKLPPNSSTPEIVKTFATDNRVFPPYELTNVQGVLYLVADDGASGVEIWKSDGTEAGTVVMTDVNSPHVGVLLTSLHGVGSALYFSVGYSNQLWKLDGSTLSTATVSTGHVEESMYAFNRLYVVASSEAEGTELFSSPLVRGFPAQGDFDEDRDSDGADFLSWQRSLGSRNRAVDGDGSGKIDGGDLVRWIQRFGSIATEPGDFDLDGVADGSDFLAWQRALGSTATPAGSGVDGDASGRVDGDDLLIWQNAFSPADRGLPGSNAEVLSSNSSTALTEATAADLALGRDAALEELFAAGDFTSLFSVSTEPGRPKRNRPGELRQP